MGFVATASPLDVRKWLCPSVNAAFDYCGSALGHSPQDKEATDGGAKPPPHIRRHSRRDDRRFVSHRLLPNSTSAELPESGFRFLTSVTFSA